MKLIAAVVLAACASAPPVAPAAPPPPAAKPVPLGAPALDDAGVIERSRALFAAEDRLDLAGFEAMLGPSFVSFENGRFFDAKFLATTITGRLERYAPVRSRECNEEHVYRGPGVAVYIGECIEHVPADGDHKAADFDGWNTVVWTVVDGVWKVAHWQWQKGGLDAEREMWNDTFRREVGFKLAPNQFLVDSVKGKKPGTALDVLMGQGRNAIYLATQGWKVTGVDISDEGIRIAKQEAPKRKVKLDAVNQDIEKYDFGTERWDLVTMIYAGSDDSTLDKVKPSVKHGGLFVSEYFLKDPGSSLTIGYDPGQLAKKFADWKIIKDDVVEDVSDWGMRKTKLVRFIAQRP